MDFTDIHVHGRLRGVCDRNNGAQRLGMVSAMDWAWFGIGRNGIDVLTWKDDREMTILHGQVEQRVETFSQTKPSNPKDALGIRKAPLSVVPMNVVAEIGIAMLEGASKYGRHNYRGVGVRSSVYFDATMRHLIDWWEGVDIDPESGMSHITKALASLTVLRDAQMQGMCTDDRPPRSAPFYEGLNCAAGVILDRHADKSPKHYTIADTKEGR